MTDEGLANWWVGELESPPMGIHNSPTHQITNSRIAARRGMSACAEKRCGISSKDAIPHLRPHGLARLRNRLRDVGHGRMERVRRRGVPTIARPRRRAGLYVLRYRIRVRRR